MEYAKNAIKLCGPRSTVVCPKAGEHNSILYTNTWMCVVVCVWLSMQTFCGFWYSEQRRRARKSIKAPVTRPELDI